MATKAKVEPTLTEITVNYSVGVKANLGNYESGDAHVSKTEKWNVTGLTADEVEALYDERYEAIRKDLGEKIEFEYGELIGASS